MSVDPFPGWPTVPASQHGYNYVHNNPVNWIDPSGLLVCEAPQAGCAEWVLSALREIENVPLPIGKLLVQALWDKDRSLQGFQYLFHRTDLVPDCYNPLGFRQAHSSDMSGFRIKFTDDFLDVFNLYGLAGDPQSFGMVTRPAHIKIKLRYFKPPNSPDGDAVLLFAHELVHVMQGSALAASIIGEVQAYQVQAALRPHLDPENSETPYERYAKQINLTDPSIRTDFSRWSQMTDELASWKSRFPNYTVPLLPCGGLCWVSPPPQPHQPSQPYEYTPRGNFPPGITPCRRQRLRRLAHHQYPGNVHQNPSPFASQIFLKYIAHESENKGTVRVQSDFVGIVVVFSGYE